MLCSPFGARLFRAGQLLNAQTAVSTVDTGERESVLEKALFTHCAVILPMLTLQNVLDAGLLTVTSPAPYRFSLARKRPSMTSSNFRSTAWGAFLISSIGKMLSQIFSRLYVCGWAKGQAVTSFPVTAWSTGASTKTSAQLLTYVTEEVCGPKEDAGRRLAE